MTSQHRPVSVTRAGQGASASVAYAVDNWRDEAACLGRVMRNFDIFFPDAEDMRAKDPYRDAREMCNGCPVIAARLADIMRTEAGHGHDTRHGFAGGKTPDERYRADDTRGTRRRWEAA
ncbi:MAG: WhiB family transcriptional regulator [Rhodoglobus sp.]